MTQSSRLIVENIDFSNLHFHNNTIDINDWTDSEQIELIRDNYRSLSVIYHPSYEVQSAAIRMDGLNAQYINNPLEEILVQAVKDTAPVVIHLKKPSERIQLLALSILWDHAYFDPMIAYSEKSDWFHREVNKLKLVNGPMRNEKPNYLRQYHRIKIGTNW